MTETLTRPSGRTSAVSVPSLVAISITSWMAANDAITCLTLGSMRRVSASMRINQATLSSSRIVSSGSTGRVQPARRGTLPCLHRIAAAAAGDGARRLGRLEQCRQQHLVGIGETGFLTADGTHA